MKKVLAMVGAPEGGTDARAARQLVRASGSRGRVPTGEHRRTLIAAIHLVACLSEVVVAVVVEMVAWAEVCEVRAALRQAVAQLV